jgi:FkbM family methyltransferase
MIVAQLTRKWVDNSPFARALADRQLAQEAIQAQRAARLLATVARFAINQRHRGSTGCYRLKRGGSLVHLRHRTRDVAIMNEIFSAGAYEPPARLALNGRLRVLDAGGNIGLFGLFALERWNVDHIRSYEPDPANARLLRATAASHRQWEVREEAVSSHRGSMSFVVGRYAESREAATDEAGVAVPAVDLFVEASNVDLLKMDIEGGEWAILEDPRLSILDVRAVVMEWHEAQCPDADPPGYAGALLADAGFVHQHESSSRSNPNGVLWAWR